MSETIIALISLVFMEIILGVDNIIFISILSDKLPPEKRNKLRYWGLGLAMIMRLLLLGAISWILKLDQALFTLQGITFTGKGLILLGGGLFLIYKSTKELYQKAEHEEEAFAAPKGHNTFGRLLMDIILLDIVFSVDSIITAVGMVDELWIMYAAVIISVGVMLFASGPISAFIRKHPSFKILALCFLMMIGVALIAEGLSFHIPKGYIYFAMGFAFLVDVIKMRRLPHHTK